MPFSLSCSLQASIYIQLRHHLFQEAFQTLFLLDLSITTAACPTRSSAAPLLSTRLLRLRMGAGG
jgi:hypothetical protein